MNRLRLPDVTFAHMPVVPTARMREIRGEINVLKAKTQRDIEALESEYSRLTVIEQHKVFAEHNRRILAREKKHLAHDLTDSEILAMAEEIRNAEPLAERALVAAYKDCQKAKGSHG